MSDLEEEFKDPALLQLEGVPEDLAYTLSLLKWDPELFFVNPAFFLHAVCTLSRGHTNFDVIPVPNSLEVVLALAQLKPLLAQHEFSEQLAEYITALLKEDGIQYPHAPFDFINSEHFTVTDPDLSHSQKEAFNAVFSQPTTYRPFSLHSSE